jgi:hypothetical protein
MLLLILAATLTGCNSYVQSTPRQVLEGDDAANYARVFREPVPEDVAVVHSVVVAYSPRPGVVTTDDFEFELLVPRQWIEKATARFYLQEIEDDAHRELEARRTDARPWYAPQPLNQYELYRDLSSIGYVHMLVQREQEPDGRQRVFISKH